MTYLEQSIADLRTNDCQWKAFETVGHCVVLAPPGSGKTKLLATRMAYDLVEHIHRPHGAVCVTLTNPAADELRKRIEMLGVESRPNLFTGTVHGFALTKIIYSFAKAAGRSDIATLSIASDARKSAAMKKSIAENFRSSDDTRYVKTTIERNRKLMASAVEWQRSGSQILRAANRYEEILREQGLMDFDDVVSIAVDLVENNLFVRQALTAQYPTIYVDEYQDLAPGLDRLVRALCFDYMTHSDLFAVGDPDQSIFGWTGTRPELLQELSSRSGVTTIELRINYRSRAEIIRRAVLLLSEDREIVGELDGGKVVAHYVRQGYLAQIDAASALVRELAAQGTALHEIAVLCATNAEGTQVASAFRRQGLPVLVRGSDYPQTPVTLLIEALAAWAVLGREGSGHRLGDLLRRWRSFVAGRREKEDEVGLVEYLLASSVQSTDSASSFIERLHALGLREALKGPSKSEESIALAAMFRAYDVGPLSNSTIVDLGNRSRNAERVEVTTMTSSKGREFGAVLILGVDEDRIPYYSSIADEKLLREDRRKFYVSLTRARHECHLFYSGFVETPWGAKKRKGPSRFLKEIGLV